MKNTIITLILIGIAIYGLGCCGAVDKAKEMADEVEETVETATEISKEMEELRGEDGEFELTQRRLDKFMKEFPIFKKVMEEKADKVEQSKDDFKKGIKSLSEFSDINKDLKDAGMDNPAEFYLTMTEVSAAMFYLSFESSMKEAEAQMKKQIEEMKKQLEDPDTPEQQKEVLREAIEGMKESEETEREIPDMLTEDELKLVRNNFDELADVLGMDVELEKETEEEAAVEETETGGSEEPAEKKEEPKQPSTGKGGAKKGTRVE